MKNFHEFLIEKKQFFKIFIPFSFSFLFLSFIGCKENRSSINALIEPIYDITIDGNLEDWTEISRLDHAYSLQVSGFGVYGKKSNSNIVLAIHSKKDSINTYSTIWLNTDQNPETGHKIFGFSGGAEFNINFYHDNKPYLYFGDAGEKFIHGPLEHAFGQDQKTLEISIPFDLIGNPEAIDFMMDINDAIFLPLDFKFCYRISGVVNNSLLALFHTFPAEEKKGILLAVRLFFAIFFLMGLALLPCLVITKKSTSVKKRKTPSLVETFKDVYDFRNLTKVL